MRRSRTELPGVSLGVMTFGNQVGREEAGHMVRRAIDAGVTLFDTADSYHEGASEEVLGHCLAEVREEVLIASKVGRPVGGDPARSGLSPEWIQQSIEGTLTRLGVDHLDLYYLHQPDPNTPIESSLGKMDELVASGKVRSVGVSNYAAWQIVELEALAQARGWTAPAVSQVLYNVISRRLEDEYAAFATAYRLPTIVYNPLAGGLLTGKHLYEFKPDSGRFRIDRYQERYWTRAQFAAIDALTEIAAEANMPLHELALRWLRSQTTVTSILIGASNLTQLEANLEASQQGPLPADVLEACDDVWHTKVGGVAPRYNR